jgi:predicted amidohydrolase
LTEVASRFIAKTASKAELDTAQSEYNTAMSQYNYAVTKADKLAAEKPYLPVVDAVTASSANVVSAIDRMTDGFTRSLAVMERMDARMERMDARMERMDARMERMDARLGRMEAQLSLMLTEEHVIEIVRRKRSATD